MREQEGAKMSEAYFKKAVLILQLTRIKAMTISQLREETNTENIGHYVDVLVNMGYLTASKPSKDGRVKRRSNHTKYKAVYRFQKI